MVSGTTFLLLFIVPSTMHSVFGPSHFNPLNVFSVNYFARTLCSLKLRFPSLHDSENIYISTHHWTSTQIFENIYCINLQERVHIELIHFIPKVFLVLKEHIWRAINVQL